MLVATAHKIAGWTAFVLLTGWFLIGSWQASQVSQALIQYRSATTEEHNASHQPIEERHQATEEAIAYYNKWLMFFTAMLAIATIALGVATIGLYLTGEKQAKAAAITANAVIDNERPWIGPRTVHNQSLVVGENIVAGVIIQNTGHAAAREMRAFFQGDILPAGIVPPILNVAQVPPKALPLFFFSRSLSRL